MTPAIARPLERIGDRPRSLALLGALTISWSAILVRLADASPSTAAVFRCAYAIPPLLLLAVIEDRRLGRRRARERLFAAAAGFMLAADLIAWHNAIADVGAGLATVLGNLQVLFLPLLAWWLLRERPARRVLAILPLMLIGIVLISGALEHGAYGRDPARGVAFGAFTGLAYAGFILMMRSTARGDHIRVAGPLFDATVSATVFAAIGGLVIGDLDLVPHWPQHGWLLLLALSSQVLGWLLIGSSLPRLPAELVAVILTVQPVGSVLLGALLLSESPTPLQLLGVAAILCGLIAATGKLPQRTHAAGP